MKLRNRIAFYYSIVSAVVVLFVFIIIFYVVHNTVYKHLDSDLSAESFEVHNSIVILNDKIIFANPNEWKENEHGQVEVNPMFIQVVDSSGNVLRKTPNLHESILPFDISEKKKIYYDTELLNNPTRQLQLPLKNSSGNILAYLIIAIPLEESNVVLDNLRIVLIVSFPLVLLLLFSLSRTIAGKSISPIDKIIKTAEKITKENLNHRIELPPHHDELYILSSTINQLLNRLEDAILREKQFTSDASHELRTPLSIIKGTLEVLIRKPRTTELYENKIQYCISEVDRISILIDQLLLLARQESGNDIIQLIEIDLNECIQEAVAHVGDAAINKNIEIVLNKIPDIKVKADFSMLGIIFENVLSNSIKYSGENQKINITSDSNFDTTIISISDNGIGMTKEQIENIYKPFYRADDSRNSNIAGSGLGLAIVKKLASLQNITLSVASVPGDGTIFKIIVPSSTINPDK